MSTKKILQIRKTIRSACKAEEQTQTLHLSVIHSGRMLHRTISIYEKNPTEAFVEFLTRYIESVPNFLEALTKIASESGIYKLIEPIIRIAENFFLSPPPMLKEHRGLHALLDEAYLAHRLMEELNDRVMASCGALLVPMDMTVSNIIVHDFIGDAFANKLDLAVLYSIKALLEDSQLINNPQFQSYMKSRRLGDFEEMRIKWPCFAGDSAIKLNLDKQSQKEVIH